MGKDKHRRQREIREPFAAMRASLLQSEAFRSLSKSARVLYPYMLLEAGLQQARRRQSNKKAEDIGFERSFSLLARDANLSLAKTFDAVQELRKAGFLEKLNRPFEPEKIDLSKGTQRPMNIYRLSSRWQRSSQKQEAKPISGTYHTNDKHTPLEVEPETPGSMRITPTPDTPLPMPNISNNSISTPAGRGPDTPSSICAAGLSTGKTYGQIGRDLFSAGLCPSVGAGKIAAIRFAKRNHSEVGG